MEKVQLGVSRDILSLKSGDTEISLELSEKVVEFLLKKMMAISGKTAYFLLEDKEEMGS